MLPQCCVYFVPGGKTHGAPDGGIRVPGMVKWPGHITPGTVSDEPTSQMDIMPVVADVVGVPLPGDRQYDGRNVLPLLNGNSLISPHEFLFHYCGSRLHAVRYRPRSGKSHIYIVISVHTEVGYRFALCPSARLFVN